jgi:hypothetical protein
MKALFLGIAVLLAATPGEVRAETAPAEPPPADFAGRQYVDSAGCAFVRATVNGATAWVLRLDAARQPVCGMAPTILPGPDAVAKAPPAGSASPEPAAAPPAAAPPSVRPPPRALADTSAPVAAPPVAKGKAAVRRRAAVPVPAGDPDAVPVTLVAVETVPGAAAPCAARPATAERYRLSDGRRIVRCGPPVADPVAYLNGLRLKGLRVAASPAPEARAFVQVGAFAVPANADRAAERVTSLGFGAARMAARVGGRAATIILAGPFDGPDDARVALGSLRAAGLSDAYLVSLPAQSPQMP